MRRPVAVVIVCLCRGVSERAVRAAIQAGATSLEQITAVCGAGSDCRACCPLLAELADRVVDCA